ncbi:MAG: DNA modification methylase [Candidatus Omnitrophota bacterium]
MKIQKIKVSEINPAVYNPRITLRPGDAEYERLKKSILTFGLVEPLILNKRTGNLVGGHQRLNILIEQGVTEVEVSIVDLSLEMEKALNIALNKISGAWDEEKLSTLLSEMQKIPDFEVGLTGFEPKEISELLDEFATPQEEDDFDFEAEVNSMQEPITKRGDIIELGRHRIICGDSSSLEDVKALIGNEKINLIHTDPPYNVNYYGGNRPVPNVRPKESRNWERIYSDNLNQEEYEIWLKKIFSNVDSFLETGASFYIWNGHKQFGQMHVMLEGLGYHIACVITWAKPNFAISYADYNQQTEFCLYGWKKDNGAHAWYGPTNASTLWEIKRDSTKEYIHPTQKPTALAQRAMKNSSKRGDIVLDLFLGSGSTLIAAEGLERRCFGLEIDPKYCDSIIRRYISYVGKDKAPADLVKKYCKEEQHVGK